MKKLSDIDYAPLQAMDTAWDDAMRSTFKLPPAIVIGVAIGLAGALFYYVPLFAILIVPGVVGSFAGNIRTQKNLAWKHFADANGWFIVPITGNDMRFVPPGIAHFGRRSKISVVVHAQFEGHECDIFLYEFQSGSGRSKRTHYYTIARVALERPFPHLILDSKKTWALTQRGNAKAKLKLEGNFDGYFSLYYDPGDHISALSVITPDVMQTLIHSNQAQDVEVYYNSLFFMTAQDHRTAGALPGLLASVDALADEFAHKAKTIKMPKDFFPHTEEAIAALRQYGASQEAILGELFKVILFMALVPAFLLLFSGFVGWLTSL